MYDMYPFHHQNIYIEATFPQLLLGIFVSLKWLKELCNAILCLSTYVQDWTLSPNFGSKLFWQFWQKNWMNCQKCIEKIANIAKITNSNLAMALLFWDHFWINPTSFLAIHRHLMLTLAGVRQCWMVESSVSRMGQCISWAIQVSIEV